MAMSLSLFVIHLFGDMPSPPVIGIMFDLFDSQRIGYVDVRFIAII